MSFRRTAKYLCLLLPNYVNIIIFYEILIIRYNNDFKFQTNILITIAMCASLTVILQNLTQMETQ